MTGALEVDHRAVAQHAALHLAELCEHLDPGVRVSFRIDPRNGATTIQLHGATLLDCTRLADLLGLPEHTSYLANPDGVHAQQVQQHHSWAGGVHPFAVTLAWVEFYVPAPESDGA